MKYKFPNLSEIVKYLLFLENNKCFVLKVKTQNEVLFHRIKYNHNYFQNYVTKTRICIRHTLSL